MSGESTTGVEGDVRAGPSAPSSGRRERTTTGNPVVDIANELGPRGETYEEEYEKLLAYLKRDGDVLGAAAPVVFVNAVRKLYRLAVEVTVDPLLRPYDRCVYLFRVFDAVVLAYKNVGFVYCDTYGARSVYGYSDSVLKNLLSRVEAVAGKVAAAVHDTYSLTVLNDVVAGTEQRLSQVRSEKDMTDFFRAVSGGSADGVLSPPSDGASDTGRLPAGVETYRDPYADVDVLLRRLYRHTADRDYVRDFHDAVYLVATANARATLSGALDTRLADKDRDVVLLEVPGDRTFASALCCSAIGYLRKTLSGGHSGDYSGDTAGMETYRINYGRLFSKYRGESERNFSQMMEWIKSTVRGGDRLRVFWFPDIENLMAPRTSNDQEHIATIKNAMLQHMDDFNKDMTLRSFLLLFNSSEGALDGAFSRRLETVVRTPVSPLRDIEVASQAVGAELARYHINLSDETAARVAAWASGESSSSSSSSSSRVGGFAYVRATLRDMYVNQKLALKYGAVALDANHLTEDVLRTVFGRYVVSREDGESPSDVLYDLDGRAIKDVTVVAKVAFVRGSKFAKRIGAARTVPIRYNSSVHGDPKDIGDREAARTIFLHDEPSET